jgi:hypothetical protein
MVILWFSDCADRIAKLPPQDPAHTVRSAGYSSKRAPARHRMFPSGNFELHPARSWVVGVLVSLKAEVADWLAAGLALAGDFTRY